MTIQEVLARWKDFEESKYRFEMLKGVEYFKGHNDIKLPQNGRYDVSLNDKNFDVIKPTKMSDRRIVNNFFKFIIQQQIAYGIARRFILTSNIVEENENTIDIFKFIKSKIFKIPTKKQKAKERFDVFNTLIRKCLQ